ncbi:MAG: hypothetical protein JOZ17_16215 [Acetobacteraceae bacterium]|nr:hypothetical protein [Acetobacteraceae bacterium]
MAGMLMDYTYKGANGDTYTGQVVADSTVSKYNYQPGQTYTYGTGTYTMGMTQTPTNAPVGSVYQSTYYDAATGQTYDSYHYDAKNNQYYDVKTDGYNKSTGMYTPSGGSPVPMWSSKGGLGTEYGYVKDASGHYHVYGGGGSAYAEVSPTTLQTAAYDYKFTYPDGSYYTGRVVDDGTFGYKAGESFKYGSGTYSITAVDPTKPAATDLAGYNYITNYYDASTHMNYQPSSLMPTSPYYNKPSGYGGVGTETSYIQKPNGYYQFSANMEATQSTPLATLPLPT